MDILRRKKLYIDRRIRENFAKNLQVNTFLTDQK